MKLWIVLVLSISSYLMMAQGPPITTGTPVMLGLEGAGIRTFGKYIKKENASAYVHVFGVPYNISPKFQVGGIIPFKWVTPRGQKRVGGLSDVAVFAKYQIFKRDGVAKTFRILATLKQTFPTGDSRSMPALGTGIYQTALGLVLGRVTSRVGLYADGAYQLRSGVVTDDLVYNLSMGVPLLPHRYPQRQINAYVEFNGHYIIDSAIHTFFLSPGLQYIGGRRILFEASVQLPLLLRNVDQNKSNYNILLGTRFLFN